ncbi:hypothetical protein [Faucicola atlantae]|uniref:hypothetical protein n=1 Tax=Faucicola atlantae TaxID=34059 RepID=UPI0025B10143|nr:hypothetical protein [Moraxella atlantae]
MAFVVGASVVSAGLARFICALVGFSCAAVLQKQVAMHGFAIFCAKNFLKIDLK